MICAPPQMSHPLRDDARMPIRVKSYPDDQTYEITPKGSAYLIKNGLVLTCNGQWSPGMLNLDHESSAGKTTRKSLVGDSSWRRAGAMLHPGGMIDGSRGLSEATPPDPILSDEMHPGRGARGRADSLSARSRQSLAPLQGAGAISPRSGGIAALNPRLPSVNPPGWAAGVQWANEAVEATALKHLRCVASQFGRF